MVEHKLAATGIIDPLTARTLGRIAGVEALITGTITPFGDYVRLSVKILDTETARVIGASSANIAKTKAIEELLAKGIAAVAPAAPPEKRTATSPPARVVQSVQAKSFTFELVDCRFSGGTVSVSMLITNKSNDAGLIIFIPTRLRRDFPKTRIFDDFGNEYSAIKVTLANKESGSDFSVVHLLVSGVPTNANILFEGDPKQATVIRLLEIGCQIYDGEYFRVQFRDVAISK